RRELKVNIVREIESRAYLPREQEGVCIWDELICAVSGCRASGTKRIFRIRIVIDELAEVREEIELQEWLRRRARCDRFAILTVLGVDRRRRRLCSKHKRMFPLLGQSFRIDVRVPHEAVGDYERVGHPASSKRKARETLVAAIGLTDVNGVAVLF